MMSHRGSLRRWTRARGVYRLVVGILILFATATVQGAQATSRSNVLRDHRRDRDGPLASGGSGCFDNCY